MSTIKQEMIDYISKKQIDFEEGVINNSRFFKMEEKGWKKDLKFECTTGFEKKFIEHFKEYLIVEEENNNYNIFRIVETGEGIYIRLILKSHVHIHEKYLQQFSTAGTMYYLDEEQKIRKGYCASYNTEQGYYSLNFEKYLSDNYETKIGKLIKVINDNLDNKQMTNNDKLEQDTEILLHMIAIRNRNIKDAINDEEFRKIFLPINEEQIEYYFLKTDKKFLNNRKVSIIINKTVRDFITLDSYKSKIKISNYGFLAEYIILTPKILLLLVPLEANINNYIEIKTDSEIININRWTFNEAQKEHVNAIGSKLELETLKIDVYSD